MSKSREHMIKSEVAIIGAGLTGLYLQYLLERDGILSVLIEARSRVGGRILTVEKHNTPPLEMGATWFDRSHLFLLRLLQELNLKTFPQKMDGRAIYNPDPRFPHQVVDLPQQGGSNRIVGGSSALIQALVSKINTSNLYLDNELTLIRKDGGKIFLQSAVEEFTAEKVVSTLPPKLFASSITVDPALPEDIIELQEKTHTWMGESIRMALAYVTPFWRDPKLSGTVFCNAGPIVELYDHSDFADDAFALSGFISNEFHRLAKEERLDALLNQLVRYYGEQARNYITYEEQDWQNEEYTFTPYNTAVAPHQNNGHPFFRKSYLDGSLFLAGTETAAKNPGYMEGAVYSALDVHRQLVSFVS